MEGKSEEEQSQSGPCKPEMIQGVRPVSASCVWHANYMHDTRKLQRHAGPAPNAVWTGRNPQQVCERAPHVRIAVRPACLVVGHAVSNRQPRRHWKLLQTSMLRSDEHCGRRSRSCVTALVRQLVIHSCTSRWHLGTTRCPNNDFAWKIN